MGSTTQRIAKRWGSHLSELRQNKHHNRLLQTAWNTFGESTFEFRILEVTTPRHAVAVEQTFIDWYKSADPKYGFNVSPSATSLLGVKRTDDFRERASSRMKTASRQPQVRAAMSQRMRKYFESPDNRAANTERQKALQRAPAARAAAADRANKRFESLDQRAAVAERTRKQLATPEARAAHSARLKAFYSDPVKKSAMLIKRRMTIASKLLVILETTP